MGLVFLMLLIVKKAVFIGGLILYKSIKSLKTACVALQTAPHHHYYIRESDGNVLSETHEIGIEEEESHGGIWDKVVKHWHKPKTWSEESD